MNATTRATTCGLGLALIVGLAGCAPKVTVTSGGGQGIASARHESYAGPKARIAVAEFEDKMSSTNYYNAAYGRGMRDMLTTALFNTNRYIMLEREKLQSVMAEQDLGASGRVKAETAAQIGELEGAELMVIAAITGFDPAVGGVGGSARKLFGSNLLTDVAGSYQKARVAMDLRVVDTRSGRLVAATSLASEASSFAGDSGLSDVGLGVGLDGFGKTPMESAVRAMIVQAVDFIVQRTPESFYHY